MSGLARGIDAEAHRGALDAGGRTIAVLGSGIENLYPRSIVDSRSGSRRTEPSRRSFSPTSRPRAQNFPRSNRGITGMTLGTLVIEAAQKSGSLGSVRLALDQNRNVFAVPGPIGSKNREGVHALIRDGARLVTGGKDVIEELRPELRPLLKGTEASEGKPVSPALDDEERSILARLVEVERARPHRGPRARRTVPTGSEGGYLESPRRPLSEEI